MKHFLKLLPLIIFFACTNEDNIDDETKTPLTASPNLSWKLLVYKTYDRDYSQKDTIAFKETSTDIDTLQNLGVVEYEGNNYNFIKSIENIQGQTNPKTKYTYSRDSANYHINIKFDTITINHKLTEDIVEKYNLSETLLEDDIEVRTFINKTKTINFVDSNAGFETVVFKISETLSLIIINNGKTKNIKTDAGTLNSNEFSIIGRNETTNERAGEGESIFYYYEDFLVQEFCSLVGRQSYVYKKELVEIEYQ